MTYRQTFLSTHQIKVYCYDTFLVVHKQTNLGQYFNYDGSENEHHNSIMAGQCAGQWYLRACGIGGQTDGEDAVSQISQSFFMFFKYFHSSERFWADLIWRNKIISKFSGARRNKMGKGDNFRDDYRLGKRLYSRKI